MAVCLLKMFISHHQKLIKYLLVINKFDLNKPMSKQSANPTMLSYLPLMIIWVNYMHSCMHHVHHIHVHVLKCACGRIFRWVLLLLIVGFGMKPAVSFPISVFSEDSFLEENVCRELHCTAMHAACCLQHLHDCEFKTICVHVYVLCLQSSFVLLLDMKLKEEGVASRALFVHWSICSAANGLSIIAALASVF